MKGRIISAWKKPGRENMVQVVFPNGTTRHLMLVSKTTAVDRQGHEYQLEKGGAK